MRNNIITFIFLLFLQVFVLNKILFFNFVILSPIVLILLLYKYQKDSKESLIMAFCIGLIFDIFNDSLGIYSLTCVLVIYFRNLWVLKIIGEEKTEELNVLSVHELGGFQFFIYSFPIIIMFYSILSLFESGDFISLNNMLFIILSSFSNYIFMLIFQLLFLKNNLNNEWR
tara:strand:+ start:10651 stop:11163 length:513 start_codon:yes stop_codon:yes gene_type:complete